MNKIEIPKINQMYEFLRLDNANFDAGYDGAFVFCRDDKLIGFKAAELLRRDAVHYVLLTGGVGKDSGNLTIPESHFQANIMKKEGISKNRLLIEDRATNGGENTRLGMELLLTSGKNRDTMLCVSHPTNSRRVLNTHRHIIGEEYSPSMLPSWENMTVTNYKFNPENPIDQAEAVGEMLRLADWPTKGWASIESGLDIDLVQYARDIEPIVQEHMKQTVGIK